jgi:hypothetical protein
MYLSSTDKLEIVLGSSVTTNQLEWVVSYQDITSAGMTLPQSSNQGLTNNTTTVDMVTAPAASTNRQVVHISVFNDDTTSETVIVKKDVSGTEYILVEVLLQANDTLEWSREIGWKVTSGTSQASYTFDVYNTAGLFTWTKPAGLKAAMVFVGGAGGGGGSGARLAAGNNRFGGGGAGGGAWFIQLFDANSLASTVAVTVGTGGTGAAGVTTDATNGSGGTTGGNSQFGAMIAAGGSGGGGGSTASGAGGGGGATSLFLPYSGLGASGGTSNTNTTATAGSPGFGILSGQTGCPGGGGGSGINSANVSATAGGAGGGVYQNGALIAGPSSGATPNGIDNKNIFIHMSTTLTSSVGVGTGGAGGYPAFVNGGNGGFCAGGGGGSGTLNGTTSGKGGNGGTGLVIVMNIF